MCEELTRLIRSSIEYVYNQNYGEWTSSSGRRRMSGGRERVMKREEENPCANNQPNILPCMCVWVIYHGARQHTRIARIGRIIIVHWLTAVITGGGAIRLGSELSLISRTRTRISIRHCYQTIYYNWYSLDGMRAYIALKYKYTHTHDTHDTQNIYSSTYPKAHTHNAHNQIGHHYYRFHHPYLSTAFGNSYTFIRERGYSTASSSADTSPGATKHDTGPYDVQTAVVAAIHWVT